jgi:hypothetical protein
MPFIIKRDDVVQKIGDCALIAVFDMAAARARATSRAEKDRLFLPDTNEENDLIYPEGWRLENTKNLLDASPRALWLMAKGGLIPMNEMEALQIITDSGRRFDRATPPIAQVTSIGNSKSLMLLRLNRRDPRRTSTRHRSRIVFIEDEGEAGPIPTVADIKASSVAGG